MQDLKTRKDLTTDKNFMINVRVDELTRRELQKIAGEKQTTVSELIRAYIYDILKMDRADLDEVAKYELLYNKISELYTFVKDLGKEKLRKERLAQIQQNVKGSLIAKRARGEIGKISKKKFEKMIEDETLAAIARSELSDE